MRTSGAPKAAHPVDQTDPEKTLSKSWNSPPLQSCLCKVPCRRNSPLRGIALRHPAGPSRAVLGSAEDAAELDGASGPHTLGEPGAGVGRRCKGAPRRPQRRRGSDAEVGGLAEGGTQ